MSQTEKHEIKEHAESVGQAIDRKGVEAAARGDVVAQAGWATLSAANSVLTPGGDRLSKLNAKGLNGEEISAKEMGAAGGTAVAHVAGIAALGLGLGNNIFGVQMFARGGKAWHVGLETANKMNLVHVGNHLKHGVHLAIGAVAPKVADIHIYLQKAVPFLRFWRPK